MDMQPAGPARAHSFDVFDTLITRCWWRPEDLFLHAGAEVARLGLTAEAPEAWAARRVAVEAALRAAPGVEEVTLSGIHREMARQGGLDAEAARRAEAAEIACEMAATRPIARMRDRVAALHRAGERVALVSDTYFTEATLLELLARNEVPHDPARVLASSERGATKRTGRIFPLVAEALGVPAARIAHAGDHPHSDVAAARAAGLEATAFTAGAPTRRERLLHAVAGGAPPLLRSAIAGGSRAARLSAAVPDGHVATLRDVGCAVAGPLLSGFVLWTLMQARARGLRRLHYVARDGQVLLRIARRLLAATGWEIECRYLHGSRQAWHLPALERLDDAALDWLAAPESAEPLRKVLSRAELGPDAIAPALRRHGLDGALDARPDRARLAALLRDAEVEPLLLANAAARRRTTLGYLRQEGLFEGGPAAMVPTAMVDVGWHGRLQRSLHRLLVAEGAPPPLGLYLGLVSRPADLPEGTLHAWLGEAAALNPVLLEIFCAADHGTTRGYEAGPDGRLAPVLAEAVDRRVLDWGLAALQDGAVAFAGELAAALARHPDHAPEVWEAALRRAAPAAFDLFRREPDAAEAEAFGSFPHADGQTHDAWAECAPRPALAGRLRLGLGLRDPAYAGHWPEGSVRRGGGAVAEGLFALRRLRRRLQGRADPRPAP